MKAKTFNPKPRVGKVHLMRHANAYKRPNMPICNSTLRTPTECRTRDKDAVTCKGCKRLLGVM